MPKSLAPAPGVRPKPKPSAKPLTLDRVKDYLARGAFTSYGQRKVLFKAGNEFGFLELDHRLIMNVIDELVVNFRKVDFNPNRLSSTDKLLIILLRNHCAPLVQ